MKDWLKDLFEAIDRKDADGFVSFLTDDACFRYAGFPVVHNKQNIYDSIVQFFSGVQGLKHNVIQVWEQGDDAICQGEVTYTFADGCRVTAPFVNIFRLDGDLIADYRIYVDASVLSG